MKRLPVLLLLLWLCCVFYVGIFLFVGGFLLVRLEVNRTSTCADILPPGASDKGDFCLKDPRFRRAVVLIVDALKADFARYDPFNVVPRPFENKLPILYEMALSRPSHTRLYTFRADPPTTTMQRIKGFTTGSLPTFIDVGNNFASSAVLEDNLVHQLAQAGRRVVFMGDDTWVSLFPRGFHRSLPFPSFNVKDLHTVDNGILQNIFPTLEGDDWDVLIAHFLGVDHCGHRFGPDHHAMAEKLNQMDGVIRSVIERLQNDTLLVVMGDHGMTDTGDHGGESQKETDAALFLYSSSPLLPAPGSQAEPEVVPQTDLVPTLALLLGVPIPYSSVGQILLPLFPLNTTLGVPTALSQEEALWINVKQVNRFLETYSSMATDIPADSLLHLRTRFSHLSSQYLSSVRTGAALTPHLVESMQEYLSSVRETCRASWARFHPLKMACGLLVLCGACAACYVMSEVSSVVLQAAVLRPALLGGLLAGSAASAAQVFVLGSVEASWVLGAAAVGSELAFLRRAWRARGRPSPRGLLTPPLLVLLLRCASLLSDSYVIGEGRVVTFLLFTLGIYVPIRLNWDGLLVPAPPPDVQKPLGFHPPALPPSTVRRESTALLVCLSVLVSCLYLSLSFHSCREEQGSCQPSAFLTPLSRMQDSRLRNLHYVLSLAALSAWTFLLHRWLRHYGNLNGTGIAAFSARCLLPLASVCMGLHWAVGATPEDSFRNLGELISLAQVVLPRLAFVLLGLGLLLLWLDPLTVYLKTRTPLSSGGAPVPPPRYRASTGISPQAELHHLIPQLYQRIRHSLEDGGTQGAEPDGRPAVEAYGLGTVYSAPLVLFCGLLGLMLLLLHPEGMALTFLMLLLQAAALLHLHASIYTLSSLQSPSNGFTVPWTPVVLWSLAASQFFHATGHLPTFSSIQWGAAFVGFPQGHTGTTLPAALVSFNTFTSHVLFAVACPLLLLWPLVCEVRGTRTGRTVVGEDGGDAAMEMKLRENPQQFSSALLQLAARYLFVSGAQMLASVCAAAVLRRHLMVWKVFAPKLMFEASAFLISSVFVLLGVSLVLRVDVMVTRLFQRLLPENSR